MKRINALAGAALLAASALVTVSAPAQATAADCASQPWPSPVTNVSTVYTVDTGFGTAVDLRKGTLNTKQAGWARIRGTTISGDLVWMDVTKDSGAHWVQCGPFSVDSSGGIPYTRAYYTSSSASYQFRACGRAVGGNSICGPWW